MEKMKAALDVLPGVSFEFTQPIQLRFNELMTGVKSDVAVKIYGDDLDLLYKKANEAASIIKEIEGAGDGSGLLLPENLPERCSREKNDSTWWYVFAKNAGTNCKASEIFV
jgi:hypothetical protein